MLISPLQQNFELIKIRIEKACQDSGRKNQKVTFVAVSKTRTVEEIREAYQLGIRDFGENYIQEWVEKKSALSDLKDLKWHFIGHLQTNKVKYLDEDIHCIQSVDRLSLLQALEKKFAGKKPCRILLQVKVDPSETQNSGAVFSEIVGLCDYLKNAQNIKWDGFMAIGPDTDNLPLLHNLYANFCQKSIELWHQYSPHHLTEPILSLGMSQDLEIALASGSNMLRVGTAFFGVRSARQ